MVAVALAIDMVVIGECGQRAGLHRAGDHETGVASDVGEVADQFGVAGEEAGPHPGQVGALRQGVDGHHPSSPVASAVLGGPSQVNSA